MAAWSSGWTDRRSSSPVDHPALRRTSMTDSPRTHTEKLRAESEPEQSPDRSLTGADDSSEDGADWSDAIDGQPREHSRHRKPTVRGFATHNLITHHAGAGGSTTCRRSEIPHPPTEDWRRVDCSDCVASRPARLRLLASDGACAVCRRQDGRCFATPIDTPYRSGIRGCSHVDGCRCQIVSA